jgi:WXG100 family type VII secretion target
MGAKLTPAQIATTATRMDTHSQAIDARVQSLLSQLGALTHGWQGPAGQAFLRAHNDWTTLSNKHNSKLKLTGEALGMNARNWANTEQANADGANKAGGAISAAL